MCFCIRGLGRCMAHLEGMTRDSYIFRMIVDPTTNVLADTGAIIRPGRDAAWWLAEFFPVIRAAKISCAVQYVAQPFLVVLVFRRIHNRKRQQEPNRQSS